MKFSESVCVPLVASLTEEMTAQSIAYHAHGTADSDKSCCYPWLVCHDIKSAMHCSLRLAPTMINHLTSLNVWCFLCVIILLLFTSFPQIYIGNLREKTVVQHKADITKDLKLGSLVAVNHPEWVGSVPQIGTVVRIPDCAETPEIDIVWMKHYRHKEGNMVVELPTVKTVKYNNSH